MFLHKWFQRRPGSGSVESLRARLETFRSLVERNNRVLELIADAGEKLGGEYIFDVQYLRSLAGELEGSVRGVVDDLNALTGYRYHELARVFDQINTEIKSILEFRQSIPRTDFVIPLDQIGTEMADAVGEKMARLGEIWTRLDCPVPNGFAITAFACWSFLQQGDVLPALEAWQASAASAAEGEGRERAQRLQEAILQASLPADLKRSIHKASAALQQNGECGLLAVRSSAVGEDGKSSFAGQYETRLGVPAGELAEAYQRVVSSLFSPSVMAYRRRAGMHPTDCVMPVGCLCMVDARSAGVVYTLDPSNPQGDTMLISSAWGLGKTVVDGTGPADRIEVARREPHATLSQSVAAKDKMFAAAPGQGLCQIEVSAEKVAAPSISGAEARRLAATALRIERYMKCAQDIEWAIDRKGRLFILQARPLRIGTPRAQGAVKRSPAQRPHKILMRDEGTVACRGVASGRVLIVQEGRDLAKAPPGSVLVARASSPMLSSALSGAAAVITDLGTPTGHLATIAREFRVPMIVGAGKATQVLRNALEVTVDAEDNIVYEGIVGELLHEQLLVPFSYEEAAEFRLLRRILKRIAPLHLNDPQSPHFAVRYCTTYHDIIRFAHEKAVEHVIGETWLARTRPSRFARRLDLDVPLDLIVVDLGGGMQASGERERVRPGELSCAPLRAVLEGMQTRGAWSSAPADMDLDGFMSSATRVGSLTSPLAARPRQNLAIVSRSYLHLSLNLGYHFNIVDCYLSEIPNDNFIYFRFAGGATELARRERRAEVLKSILGKYDFVVEVKGDLVIARIKKVSLPDMEERLRMVGRLIGCTRQLDVVLRDDSAIDRCVERFMAGQCNLTSG